MKLLVDLGNTRLKWQLVDGVEIVERGACAHDDALAQLCRLPLDELGGAWLASVGQAALARDVASLLQEAGCPVIQLATPAAGHGVTHAYVEPQRLGVDRWLGLVAARSQLAGAAVIVDAGTAMTIDQLDHDGFHRGGMIQPGLGLMRMSLNRHTELLPEVEGGQIHVGRSTEAAIAAGTLNALVSSVESVWRRACAEMGEATCVITGGDGELVYNHLSIPALLDKEWIFKGLLAVANSGE